MVTDKIIALALHLGLSVEEMLEITECEYDNDLYKAGNKEYYVFTDDEADKKEEECVRNMIEDCYLSELTRNNKNHPALNYIDIDRWVEDWCGHRGQNLASYDGYEEEQEYDGEVYYIYRVN